MRVAVSGSHRTGKSTLIAAFVERRPQYTYEPEAYEALADDIAFTDSEGPTPEGLQSLLEYTVAAVTTSEAGACVVFERTPVDYLAYAAAIRGTWSSPSAASFLRANVSAVRASLRHLDLIALLPIPQAGPQASRAAEGERFRRRVDERLRRALIDDDYDLFGASGSPRVVELSPFPERQLEELIRLTLPEP
jgi:predicted ATPase